jgi:hypothetical protein
MYDPLHFVLFHPLGQQGFHLGIPLVGHVVAQPPLGGSDLDGEGGGQNEVTERAYAAYLLMVRVGGGVGLFTTHTQHICNGSVICGVASGSGS